MYTLDIKILRKIYFFLSCFCFLFSFVYESFSHDVYSIYMFLPGIFLFLFGFVLVSFTYKFFTKWSISFYNTFLAFLIVGFYMMGILEIFGTTNELVKVYFLVSGFFFVLTVFSLWKGKKKNE